MSINKIKSLYADQGFKKYFFNTSWLLATQGVRLFVGFFVGLWLARYLEPENYGLYNYIIAIISIFMAFTKFGTEDVLVKNLVLNNNNDTVEQLNSAFYLRLGLSTLSILGILIFYFIEKGNESFYLLICSVALVFQTFEVIDIFYRATVNVKLSAFIRIAQIIISSALKIYLIINDATLVTFFYIFILDAITYSIPIYISYIKNEKDFVLYKPNFKKIVTLTHQCSPIMISTILTIVLSRVEHFIIANTLGNESLGFYVSAYKIIEIGSLIPLMIISSLFTAIINGKNVSEVEYNRRFFNLSRLLIYYSLIFSFFVFLFSEQIIQVLYGSDYYEAGALLKLFSFHTVALTFMLLNSRWFIAEDLNKIVMLKMIGAVILNIALNFILIPKFGLNGAIISTFATHLFFFYIIDLFFKKTRGAFYINSSFILFRGIK